MGSFRVEGSQLMFLVECMKILFGYCLNCLHSHFGSFYVFFSTQSSKKTRSILEAAYADNGLALDYYRGFDADWNEPA